MWHAFHNKSKNFEEVFLSIEDWKKHVFSVLDVRIKTHFAQRVSLYFDNSMLFNRKNGMHDNLMEALSQSEKDIQEIESVLFPSVKAYWVPEAGNHIVITSNLPEDEDCLLGESYGFSNLSKNLTPYDRKVSILSHASWQSLIFSPEISSLSKGWINYTPSLKERVLLQVKAVLLGSNGEMDLLKKMDLEKNIESHPKFKELFAKIEKLMPQIEALMEEEWRHTVVKKKKQQILKSVV